MGKDKKTEVFGMLGKKETLFTIHEKTLSGTLVFESLAPFPGYYVDVPNDTKPVYLYIATDKEYSVFDIERAHKAVMKKFNLKFEAAKATITIYDKYFHVIRLRHLEHYDDLAPIQEAFLAFGIKPKFLSTHWKGDEGYIELHKLFYLQKIAKGIYKDVSEEFHSYLEIPKRQSFTSFEEVARQVKYNASSSNFDVAAGCFFRKGKLKEMVRIYSKKEDIEFLEELKKLFHDKTSK